MAGEGQILRNARVDKGWSLTQAEEVTKIRIRYLEALEDEEYNVLPGSTYTKGFIRTYAKHLGLSSDEVLALYKASEQPIKEPVVVEKTLIRPKKIPTWVKPTLVALTGVVALSVVILIATLSKQQGTGVTPKDITTPLPTIPQEEIVQQPETSPTTQTPPETLNPATTPNSVETPNPLETPAPDPQNVIAQEAEGLVAQLIFSQPCWVRINVDGKPALEGTFTQGVTKELKAKEQIELVTVGNAGGLSVILNGKTYPSLGTEGQVVHNIILKKDTGN
ncbi:RodZ domain-containing protein [Desulfitobacterium sp. THU1]|uniref:helix-turn-helix domain-containing protein n=1 Tax=Desulfitobacterium sp. THU1 TaxID=3138072 RepID=UPI00311E68B8